MATEVTIRIDVDTESAIQKIKQLHGDLQSIGVVQAGGSTGGIQKMGQSFDKTGKQAKEAGAKIKKAGDDLQKAGDQGVKGGKGVKTLGDQTGKTAKGLGGVAKESDKFKASVNALIKQVGMLNQRIEQGGTVIKKSDKTLQTHAKRLKGDVANALIKVEKLYASGKIDLNAYIQEQQKLNALDAQSDQIVKRISDTITKKNKTLREASTAQANLAQATAHTENQMEAFEKGQISATNAGQALQGNIRLLERAQAKLNVAGLKGSKQWSDNAQKMTLLRKKHQEVTSSTVKLEKETARLRKALASAGNDKDAIQAVEQQLYNLKGTISKVNKEANEFTGKMAQRARKAAKEVNKLGRSAQGAQQKVAHMGKVQSHASVAMLDASRIIEDSAFGIRGVANNIVPAIQSFSRLNKTAGGTGKAFKGLMSSLIGPGGLFVLVSILTTLLITAGDSWKKFVAPKHFEGLKMMKEALDQAKESVKAFKEELEEYRGRVGSVDALQDIEEANERVVNRLNSVWGQFFFMMEYKARDAYNAIQIFAASATPGGFASADTINAGNTKVFRRRDKLVESVKERLKYERLINDTMKERDKLNKRIAEFRDPVPKWEQLNKELLVTESIITQIQYRYSDLWNEGELNVEVIRALVSEMKAARTLAVELQEAMDRELYKSIKEFSDSMQNINLEAEVFDTPNLEKQNSLLNAALKTKADIVKEIENIDEGVAGWEEKNAALQDQLEYINAEIKKIETNVRRAFAEAALESYHLATRELEIRREIAALGQQDTTSLDAQFDNAQNMLNLSSESLAQVRLEKEAIPVGDEVPEELKAAEEFFTERVEFWGGEWARLNGLLQKSTAKTGKTLEEILADHARRLKDVHDKAVVHGWEEIKIWGEQQKVINATRVMLRKYGFEGVAVYETLGREAFNLQRSIWDVTEAQEALEQHSADMAQILDDQSDFDALTEEIERFFSVTEEAAGAVALLKLRFDNGSISFDAYREGLEEVSKSTWRAMEELAAAGDLAAKIWLEQNPMPDFSEMGEEMEEQMTTWLDSWVEMWKSYKIVAEQALDVIGQLMTNAHERRINEIEAEKKAVNDKYAKQLANERLTENMRSQIQQKRERALLDIDRKEQEMRKKQAEAAKAHAIFQAIINTAQSFTKVIATHGWFGIPLAKLTVALGAAQVAAIAAQPLPSFEEGVTNFSGGIARVHQDELLVNLPQGSNVITNENVDRLAALNTPGTASDQSVSNELLLDISDGLQGLRNDVLDQTDRLERVERVVDIREMDERLTRYQHEEGR